MTEYPKRLNRLPKELVNTMTPQELSELRQLLALPDSIHSLKASLEECSKEAQRPFYQERLMENISLMDKLCVKWDIDKLDLTPSKPQLVEEVVFEYE